MSSTTVSVPLSRGLRQKLDEEPVGSGGYQSLMAELRSRRNGQELEIDAGLRKRIEHYAYDYGSGVWQNLLRELLDEIERTTQRQR